jgi:uncharacterized protein (DUF885 family)
MDRRTMMIGTTFAAVFAAARALPHDTDGSKRLNALFDRFMQENLDLSPLTVTNLGMDTGLRAAQKSEIDDGSVAGIERQKALIARQLARLTAFDRASLSAAGTASYDVVMYGLRMTDTANRAFHYGLGGAGQPYVLSQISGSYQQLPSFLDTQHTIETKADADAYIARLAGFSTLLDQELEVARHDRATGVIPPDFVLAKTLIQMQALRALPPEESPLTTSVARRAKEKKIPGDYAQQASRAVKEKIYPALERQIALVTEMQKKAHHDAGIWRLPEGEAYYTASLVTWTTTNKSPAEIHELGLTLVKQHTAQIDTLMRKLGVTQGTVGERLRAMYKDPKSLYPNTDAAKQALLVDLNARVQRLRAKLSSYFGTVPAAEVEIRRIPREIEAGASSHYDSPSLDGKRPGIYWINLRDTAEKPKWTLPTLTYHESIPGHHLQLSIQQEANLPLIRKVSFYSAYAEGWALYAEQLAAEMGEYDDDPLGHIGQLHASMYRAVRLVADTGLHRKQWTREEAVRYFADTLGDPETSAITEVERYCVWPGQACAYMLGKLAFLAQRARAQEVLGAKYDIRKFHDAMLLPGAVPLELLEQIYALPRDATGMPRQSGES